METLKKEMINNKQIIWSETCVDPGCRVFFVGKRVFRAYEEWRRQETLDFLNSECYSMLRSKHMVVRTWVTDDIVIDGYPLILEHERLCCMPEKWLCFEMLKDVLTFHFEINSLCKHYGYGIRDIGFGNVTLNNGKLCFTDFGSFRKADQIDLDVYTQCCLPLAYLPIAIYARNDGNDFIADSMIGDYDRWNTAQKQPRHDTLYTHLLWHYLHPIVAHYNLRVLRKTLHYSVRSAFTIWLIKMINRSVQWILPNAKNRDLIKIYPTYSDVKASKVVAHIKFPYMGDSYYPIESQCILQYIPNIIAKQIEEKVKRIVLWGNFEYNELIALRQLVDAEIIVMSSDRIYTNELYKKIRKNRDNLFVLCCNAMQGKDFNVFGALRTDMLVLQEGVYNQAHFGSHSDWAEKASYFAEFLLTDLIPNDEIESSKISNFYKLCYNKTYQVYQRLSDCEGLANTPPRD